MDNILDYLDWIMSFIGAGLGWFLGGFDGFVYMLLTLALVDYITGVMAAIVQKKLSSSIGFKGIARKITMFALVGVANILDKDFLGGHDLLRTGVLFFYLANEGLSILENAVKIGVQVPDAMKEKLLQFKNNNEEKKKKK